MNTGNAMAMCLRQEINFRKFLQILNITAENMSNVLLKNRLSLLSF